MVYDLRTEGAGPHFYPVPPGLVGQSRHSYPGLEPFQRPVGGHASSWVFTRALCWAAAASGAHQAKGGGVYHCSPEAGHAVQDGVW
jgi:hypothetical protein